ncbi:MAG TPA: DUF1272 domain-containing protein [Candidatus Angelobacter sp.]|jgi:hypothetical protein
MALQMKSECEKCHGTLPANASAMICSYECTFCESCSAAMKNLCPNCGGELVPRPQRK